MSPCRSRFSAPLAVSAANACAGHHITALVRTPTKLPAALREKITVVQGDALNTDDVRRAVPPDTEAILAFGARFVRWYSETFLKHRHFDKEHQIELLQQSTDVNWYGIRPLQMGKSPRKEKYRLGYHRFSGLSKISFADCAHAILGMLEDNTWLHKAPIVQY